MFGQRNQPFTTLDLVLLVGLFGLVSTFAGALLAQGFQDTRPLRAAAQAEALALQLQSQHSAATRSLYVPGDRSPASVQPFLTDGLLGRDPWGRPYHYFVRPGSIQGQASIVVWSEGPDRVAQSNPESLIDARSAKLESSTLFQGDDIGYLHQSTTAP